MKHQTLISWNDIRLAWMIVAGSDAANEQQESARAKCASKPRDSPLDLKSFDEGYADGVLNASHYTLMALEACKAGKSPNIAELISMSPIPTKLVTRVPVLKPRRSTMHKIIEAAALRVMTENGAAEICKTFAPLFGEAIEADLLKFLPSVSSIFKVAGGDAVNPATGGENDVGQKWVSIEERCANGAIQFSPEFGMTKQDKGFGKFKDGDEITLLMVPNDHE